MKNREANKRIIWLQQNEKTGNPSRKKHGCKLERKRGLKKGKKEAEKSAQKR